MLGSRLREMLHTFITNFAKPRFDLGSDDKIVEADQTLHELQHRKQNIERRLKLLEIQGNPRGHLNG